MPDVILVVDDEPSIQHSLSLLLDDEGFIVRCTRNGAEALAQLEDEPADLILSDVMMPVLDGITLVDELRRRGDRTPVVLMSTSVPRISGHSGVRFIPKPFDVDTLLAVVRQCLTEDLQDA